MIKKIIRSLTDPDAGLSVKHDKLGRFAYYDHRIVDGLHNFILDCYVTSATTPGHRVVLERFDRLYNVHRTYAKEVALDAGYYNVRVGEGLEKRKMFAYISYRRYARNEHPKCKTTQFRKVEEDLYACPCGVPFFTKTRRGKATMSTALLKKVVKAVPTLKRGIGSYEFLSIKMYMNACILNVCLQEGKFSALFGLQP